MPMNWLVKEEPKSYSFERLTRDKTTRWSGVRNPLAQRHLRSIRKGDRILYYHTGSEKAVVGLACATSDAYPDPGDASGRLSAVDIAPVRTLPRPVTLAELRVRKSFAGHPLLRIPRLSVMPLSDRLLREVERLSAREP
jgi:predicted RNA-binding protein with PUA-like domain